MNIPKQVKIGAHIYKVLFPYGFKERNDYCGQIDHNLLEIRISGFDPASQIPRADSKILGTLVHEIVHGISESWEIDLEESQVRQLGEGILAVLIDNNFFKETKN